MAIQSEAALEEGLIKALKNMSYEYVKITEESNLVSNFKCQLEKHNSKELAKFGREHLTDKEFERVMIYLEGGSRFEKAQKLRDILPLDLDNGEGRVWIEFLNCSHWCQNEFQVANQITVEGRKKCRYDVTILINGLPLVQIELKRRGVELKEAYNQVQRYHKTSFHGLFDYIQIFVISNGVNTRYFANNPNQGYKFTFSWTDIKNSPFNDLGMFAAEFFDKCTLGKLIAKYIVLHQGDKCLMVLRPYQYYAVEKILDRVENSNRNGYIWHTTGAGKTLTSFKAAQLIGDIDGVDKVMFVVDRHDLDTQTQEEYNAFDPGAVDNTDNTSELIKRLRSNGRKSKIIITTLQKLNAAVTKDCYAAKLADMRDRRMIMIFDECHRSHFGESHRNIVRFFRNSQVFGFTGTPIFTENAVGDRTTQEIFGECLHSYLIKDAIADENVLGFLVEYYIGNTDVSPDNEARMKEVAQFILNNFNKSTYSGEFDALFALPNVDTLIRYYKLFKELNPKIRIGAIFTYTPNSSQDDSRTGTNSGFDTDKVEADELQAIMDDYNAMYGTQYTTDNFRAYYDDINRRMRKKDPAMKSLDLLLVVGMFLTGFDSKKLNTLYVDKDMNYHGLLQAFSRTNRILNEKKRFGKIICFRDLKDNVDASIRLFSNEDNADITVLRPAYKEVRDRYNEIVGRFKIAYPTVQSVDQLQSEEDKIEFIRAFREIIKTHAEIQVYEEYNPDDAEFMMKEQEYNDYKSKYLDIVIPTSPASPSNPGQVEEPAVPYGPGQSLEDIDFCLELLHSDIINVAYILALIADLNPSAEDYPRQRQNIIDTMIRDAEMRNKATLIDGFIREQVDTDPENFEREKADGSIDLETRLIEYVKQKRVEAINDIAVSEDIPVETIEAYLKEYEYIQKEKTEIIQDAVKEKHLGLVRTRKTVKRIQSLLANVIRTFNWD